MLNPHTFLSTERWTVPIADKLVVRRRYQDEVALGAGVPSEQECPPADGVDAILGIYTEMYDAYFEQRRLIPERPLCDIGYEELERDPVGVIGSIYKSLGLSGFEDMRPGLERYLASIAGYRKNRLELLPEPLRSRIAHEWRRSFEEWGYAR